VRVRLALSTDTDIFLSMRTRRIRSCLAAAGVLAVGACGFFEDPTPETLFFTLSGPAGTQVEVVYSTQFVAGVNELGVTEVQVFLTDTVVHTLPIDTLFDISIDRRWFVQVTPLGVDEASVQARVDVDDRTVLNEQGLIFPATPWRFAYLFNQTVTRSIDVVL
jgi:hypothetical protein